MPLIKAYAPPRHFSLGRLHLEHGGHFARGDHVVQKAPAHAAVALRRVDGQMLYEQPVAQRPHGAERAHARLAAQAVEAVVGVVQQRALILARAVFVLGEAQRHQAEHVLKIKRVQSFKHGVILLFAYIAYAARHRAPRSAYAS